MSKEAEMLKTRVQKQREFFEKVKGELEKREEKGKEEQKEEKETKR